jgi:hypothetical protein
MDASDFAIFPASAMATGKKVVSGDLVVCRWRDPNACRHSVPAASRSGSDDAKLDIDA